MLVENDTQALPELNENSLQFSETLHGLLALTQLLGSIRPQQGAPAGTSPMIILTAAGVEMRMSSEAAPLARSAVQAQPAISDLQQAWFRKIEEGLESVRQATAALSAAFGENVKKMDHTVASHATAIDSVRSALTQNEQLMESMVELLGPADFSLPQSEEYAIS